MTTSYARRLSGTTTAVLAAAMAAVGLFVFRPDNVFSIGINILIALFRSRNSIASSSESHEKR